ncbi:MAG: UDP-N-acetyl-D-mannosamine dehydrogenase [Candidatus Pacebacteria bacterium]|nr:UDP-N-acetyl-D-mannosamine dehydrogenase [Candidatus Paceibacterota bacterium]
MKPLTSVSMIGLGYIGLPTAAVLADSGLQVIGVDINPLVVDTINRGEIHIVEPDLDAVVHRVVKSGRLRAVLKPEATDAYLIAVPTPFIVAADGHKHPDLRFVEAAAKAIAPVLRAGSLVILESTSPVGSTEKLQDWLAAARPDLTFPKTAGEKADIQLAYCPERVLPGQVLTELIRNDRIIGGMTTHCAERAASLYRHFVKGECLLTNARTAEMCKLTENAYRDTNIAFANELSLICDHIGGINVWELIKLANHHPRVKILQPGPGVGGHCIAVDPWFIVDSAPDQARLIRTAREVNDSKPHYIVDRVLAAARSVKKAGGKVAVIACLGLAFKPDIDDLRESPAVEIVLELAAKHQGEILVVEPHIDHLPRQLQGIERLRLVGSDEALQLAHLVVMLVNHREFYALDRAKLSGKSIVDSRGVWQ